MGRRWSGATVPPSMKVCIMRKKRLERGGPLSYFAAWSHGRSSSLGPARKLRRSKFPIRLLQNLINALTTQVDFGAGNLIDYAANRACMRWLMAGRKPGEARNLGNVPKKSSHSCL